MRALAVAVLVSLVPSVARAEAGVSVEGPGFLSGLGVVLLAVAGGGLGVGLSATIDANVTTMRVAGYPSPPAASDVANLRAIEVKVAELTSTAAAGFLIGGAALIGGFVLLGVDGARASAKVSVAPTPGGGALTLHVRF